MSARTLALQICTPDGLVFDDAVARVRAEDESGWFGVWPGREDIVAALPPGLLLFVDDDGEGFCALGAGLLSVVGGTTCTVVAREAVISRRLDDVAARLAELQRRRSSRAATQRDVLHQLAHEAFVRLIRQVRQEQR